MTYPRHEHLRAARARRVLLLQRAWERRDAQRRCRADEHEVMASIGGVDKHPTLPKLRWEREADEAERPRRADERASIGGDST